MKPCALGLVYKSNKQAILLVLRRDVPVWVLPGGGIDLGETAEEAVVREVQEESGFTTRLKKKVALYHPKNLFTSTTHIFELEIIGGNIATSEESKEVAFFSIDNLPKNVFELHKVWIERAVKQVDGLIEQTITEVTWWRLFIGLLKHPIMAFSFICTKIKR